jgi:hypothetical protein
MAVHTEQPSDQHTFLLAEGTWEAEGTGLLPATGTEAKIIGRTEVRHHDGDRITNEGWMRVQMLPPFEVQQRYDFKPARRARPAQPSSPRPRRPVRPRSVRRRTRRPRVRHTRRRGAGTDGRGSAA